MVGWNKNGNQRIEEKWCDEIRVKIKGLEKNGGMELGWKSED